MVISPSAAGESHHKLKQLFPRLKCRETKDILEWKTWRHNISFFNSQLDGRTMTSLRPLRRASDASIHGTWTMLPIVEHGHCWTQGLSGLASAGPCIASSSRTWDLPFSHTVSPAGAAGKQEQAVQASYFWNASPSTSWTSSQTMKLSLLLSYLTAVCQPETLESVPSCSWKHRHSSPKSASSVWSESFEYFLKFQRVCLLSRGES